MKALETKLFERTFAVIEGDTVLVRHNGETVYQYDHKGPPKKVRVRLDLLDE